MNLYQLEIQLEDFLRRAEEQGGELSPDALLQLDILQQDVESAVLYVCRAVKNVNGIATMMRSEANPFISRARQKENQSEIFRSTLLRLLEKASTSSVVVGPFKVTVRDNPVCSVVVDPIKVNLYDLSEVEKEFPQFVETVKTLNKASIAAAYNENPLCTLPDGVKVIYGKHVRIDTR